jgi:hypothetical protein
MVNRNPTRSNVCTAQKTRGNNMKLHRITPALIAAAVLATTISLTSAFSGLTARAQRVSSNPASAAEDSKPSVPVIAADYGKLPLSFEANEGQTDPQVRFTSKGSGYSLFLTDKEAVLALSKGPEASHLPKGDVVFTKAGGTHSAPRRAAVGLSGRQTDVIHMQLAGAKSGLKVKGEEQLPGTANYFIGSDPSKWRRNVPTYAKVKYSTVYPGVDLSYYGNQGRLEYDFVVAPGANPNQVKLHFAGTEKLKLDSGGNLIIITKNGGIAFHKPVVYQVKNGQPASQIGIQREPVEGKFTLLAGNSIGFKLGAYDKSRTVVIDPTLAYSTYLGGSNSDAAQAIAVDADGNAYVAGTVSSTNFPLTSGAFQTICCGAFVTKLNSAGNDVIYSTFLYNADAFGIAIDASGNAYLTGSAGSGFPVTTGAFQTVDHGAAHGVSNAFVTKLNPSGTALLYSTYLGGSGPDYATGIAVDAFGHAYVTGNTISNNFPVTKGAFQTVENGVANGVSNAFVTKLNPAGTALVYSTFLGGHGVTNANGNTYPAGDQGNGISVDPSGEVYVTGQAYSTDFPVTKSAFQIVNHGAAKSAQNAFMAKLNPEGSALIYSTYLGGSGGPDPARPIYNGDIGHAIAVDVAGNAYVTGTAYSEDFPVTENAFQTTSKSFSDYYGNSPNAFVTKLNPEGTSLVYSTYLGGDGGPGGEGVLFPGPGDSGQGIAIDSWGNAWVTGSTGSGNFPVTAGALQTKINLLGTICGGRGGTNNFLSKINPSGSSLIYSTYLGGSGQQYEGCGDSSVPGGGDVALGVALDRSGSPYITGYTNSDNFPVTANAFQLTNYSPPFDWVNYSGVGGNQAFITRFVQVAARTVTTIASNPNLPTAGQPITYTAHVYPVLGDGIPTGTVAFSMNGIQVAVATLDDTGHASYTTSYTAGSMHWVQAIYSGDTSYGASYGELNEVLPAAKVSTSYLPFGSIAFGTSKTLPVTVANIGGGTLTVSPLITGNSPFSPPSYTIAAGGSCEEGVTSGNSCTLQVHFSPTSIAAKHDDLLTVRTNGGNFTVNLDGAAVGLSVFGGISGGALQFGSVSSGSTEVMVLTITNVGLTGTVKVGTAITAGPPGSPFTILTTAQNTCLAGIAAGQSCTLPVEFAPTSSGTHNDLLTLTPSDGGGSTTVWLVGSTP